MKRLIMFVLLFAGIVVWVIANSSVPGKENLKGIWEYKVPDAPYEYSSGKLVFDEVDGKATVTVRFKNGTEIKAQDVKLENDSFSFEVQVEYEMVKVTGKLADNRITGKVNSSQGIMNMTTQRPTVKTN
jgi:hypothetical protein